MLHFLEKFGVNTKILLGIGGLMMIVTVLLFVDIRTSKAFGYMLTSAPVWLPVITFYLFFEYWMYYVQKEYDIGQGRVTLEIKIPQDVFKSPEAMELVLNQLYQTAAPDNHKETYIDGKHPPVFGLEIVSRAGAITFYINTPRKKYKNIVETQLYAQYPGVEVHELEVDYTAEIPWNPDKYAYFSLHMGLKKADAYPIKTYIEFGMEKLPKEEEKVDPLGTMIETLGSMGPGEQFWIQTLIHANREVTFKEGALVTVPDWKDAARAEIKSIIEKANKRVGIDQKVDPTQRPSMMNVSDGEKETIKAIERSIGKNAFNTAIRTLYVAEKDNFKIGERVPAVITAWRSYDDNNRNAIGVRWRTDYDWPWWQDPHGHRRLHLKQNELDEYKRRAYTPMGHSSHGSQFDEPKVMTVEELATIFHLPGKVVSTPSLARIPSKRAEAPSNLPTGII